MKLLLAFASLLIASACSSPSGTADRAGAPGSMSDASGSEVSGALLGLSGDTLAPMRLSDEEWEAKLDAEAFYILRENGTERAFSSDLNDQKSEGIFVCKACQLPAYSSTRKFKSGTGWPSFFQPIRDAHVLELTDNTYGMARTEVRCARCDGHHGHVFNDGPKPTGLRYCINGDALEFVAGATDLPTAKP